MSDDLISRQAAIAKFEPWLKVEGYSEGELNMLKAVLYELTVMPSAETEWISVKDRLPKDNVPVNITWINRNPEPYYKSIKDVPFTATGVYFKGKWYWYSSNVEDYLAEYGRAEWDEIEETMADCIEVTAWMPLPEPYKERRTDD